MGWRGDGTVEEEEGAEGSEGSHLSAHKSFVRRGLSSLESRVFVWCLCSRVERGCNRSEWALFWRSRGLCDVCLDRALYAPVPGRRRKGKSEPKRIPAERVSGRGKKTLLDLDGQALDLPAQRGLCLGKPFRS